jgi:hypothetical protein
VRQVAGDVDVAARDVEAARVDGVAVGVGRRRVLLERVVGVMVAPTLIDGVSSGGV